MASAEERTEQATPRKRQTAREKGQVSKSMEVNSALTLLAALLALQWFGGGLVTSWEQFARESLHAMGRYTTLDLGMMQQLFIFVGTRFYLLVLPPLLFVMVVGVAANVLQTGFIFSSQALAFDFARLNPLQGIARMFSARSTMDLLKSAAKAAVLAYLIYAFFRNRGPEIIRLITSDFAMVGPTLFMLAIDLLMKTTVALAIIAGIDFMFQRQQFEKNLRMSKQEIKEEYKRTEGDPLIKSRARQRQREMAQHRMMADVKKATVVITNPTHIAVALRYEPGEMTAPVVVAMGQRLVAQKIKELAREHRIPVIENKPLARALFAACNVGDSIPGDLFSAVAEIIAFVFRQNGRTVQPRSASPARA